MLPDNIKAAKSAETGGAVRRFPGVSVIELKIQLKIILQPFA